MVKEDVIRDGNQLGWLRKVARSTPMSMPHRHDALEMNVVTRGRAAYLLQGRRYELLPRASVWLFPEQEHMLADTSPDFEMWVAVFSTQLIKTSLTGAEDEFALLRAANPRGEFCRLLPRQSFERLDRLMHELLAASAAEARAGLGYLLLNAWKNYLQAEPLQSAADVHPAIEKAVRLLQHEGIDCGTEELAEMVSLSRSRLSRLFRSQIGQSIPQFRNRLRIDKFLHLYGSGQRLNMLEAALATGFGSYAQFFRAFRAVMGVSPKPSLKNSRSTITPRKNNI